MFNSLMKEAIELGEHLDTEWAEKNSAQYDAFAEKIEYEYSMEHITAKEFNDLACTAFYDYADLKEENKR